MPLQLEDTGLFYESIILVIHCVGRNCYSKLKVSAMLKVKESALWVATSEELEQVNREWQAGSTHNYHLLY